MSFVSDFNGFKRLKCEGFFALLSPFPFWVILKQAFSVYTKRRCTKHQGSEVVSRNVSQVI